LRRTRSETQKGIPHMADGTVSHQAFDIGLTDSGKRTQHHRQHGDRYDDLLPLVEGAGERPQHGPHKEDHRRDLGRHEKERRDRGGGALIWNGTAEILKARPEIRNTIPKIKPTLTLEAVTMWAIAAKSVVPVKP